MAPFDLLRPGRAITGLSAVLLPFRDGRPDLAAFESLLGRTIEAGLVPAVNMDTGYVNLLSSAERAEVLAIAARVVDADGPTLAGVPLVAGAFVDDGPGAAWDPEATLRAVERVAVAGAVPVVFPSFGLARLGPVETVAAFDWLGARCDRFVAFELSTAFSAAGRIWDLDTYAGVMGVPSCVGAKHSSLHREPEWDRLRLRDAHRPAFHVFTGNDLAIDMVMYGSDYLLGLSAFAPDAFGARDAAWAAGDPSFHERNDALQALGAFTFRDPVPAYRHSAAQFLHLRGWLPTAEAHPAAPTRPDADVGVLAGLLERVIGS